MTTSTRLAYLRTVGLTAAAVVTPRIARAQAPVVLRVGSTISDPFAEPYYAKEAGAFTRLGFELDVTPLANAGAITAALAGGSLELGVVDAVACANAVIRGVPLQVIAGAALYSSKRRTYVLTAAKAGPLRTARDFEGRTIAVSTLAATGAASTKIWLAKHGADVDKIHFIEMPMSSMAAAVGRGSIDGAVLAEPALAQVRSEVREIGRPLDAVANEFMQTAWIATRDWVSANPARTKQVVQAIYATARWANAHEDETLVILARVNRQDPDQLRGMSRTLYATSLAPAQLQPLLDMAAKFKLIERPIQGEELIGRV